MTIAPASPAQIAAYGNGPATGPLYDLLRQAEEADAAMKLAERALPTAFVPDSLKVWIDPQAAKDGPEGRTLDNVNEDATIAQVAVAIVKGTTLGFPWTTALEIIVVINNRPFITSIALRALIQRTPFLRMEVTETNSSRAIVTGWRRGDDGTWSAPQQSIWDIERARRGIRSFGQRDGMWTKMPGNMLLARATAEDARIIGADVVLGVPYVAEEADSFGEPEWEADGGTVSPPTAPPSPGSSRQRRAPGRAATGGKARRSGGHDDGGGDPGPEPATDDQRTEIHSALASAGITKAAEQRATVNLMLGLEGDAKVQRMTDLSREQADQVLTGLREEAATKADQAAAKDTDPGNGKAATPPADDSAQGKLDDTDTGEGAKS